MYFSRENTPASVVSSLGYKAYIPTPSQSPSQEPMETAIASWQEDVKPYFIPFEPIKTQAYTMGSKHYLRSGGERQPTPINDVPEDVKPVIRRAAPVKKAKKAVKPKATKKGKKKIAARQPRQLKSTITQPISKSRKSHSLLPPRLRSYRGSSAPMAVKLVNMAIDRMTREDLNTLADELEVDRTKLYDSWRQRWSPRVQAALLVEFS